MIFANIKMKYPTVPIMLAEHGTQPPNGLFITFGNFASPIPINSNIISFEITFTHPQQNNDISNMLTK